MVYLLIFNVIPMAGLQLWFQAGPLPVTWCGPVMQGMYEEALVQAPDKKFFFVCSPKVFHGSVKSEEIISLDFSDNPEKPKE